MCMRGIRGQRCTEVESSLWVCGCGSPGIWVEIGAVAFWSANVVSSDKHRNLIPSKQFTILSQTCIIVGHIIIAPSRLAWAPAIRSVKNQKSKKCQKQNYTPKSVVMKIQRNP